MTEFFQMGGHGGYIWPAYGVSAIILAGFLFATLRRYRRLKKQIQLRERLETGKADG